MLLNLFIAVAVALIAFGAIAKILDLDIFNLTF